MSKGKRRLRVSGAVLVMVLIVMVVLIMMLMATLTVVTSAGQRIYTKYEENQAYYSARSALDIYANTMLKDQRYNAVKVDGTTKQTHRKEDNSADLATFTQGLAMELDLYDIKAHAATYDDYLAMADKTQFSTEHWVNPNGVFTSEPMKTDYDSPTVDYIEYEVTYPQISNGSGNEHGKLADANTIDNTAIIKVEVLSRTFGGHDELVTTSGDSTDIMNITKESRSKDKMTIKVTSTVYVSGVKGQAVAIYSTDDNPSQFNNALTAKGGITPFDNTVIIGGATASADEALGNQGAYYGGFFAGGKLNVNNGGSIVTLEKETAMYVGGNFNVANKPYIIATGVEASDTIDESNMPIMYVDNDVTYDSNFYLGCNANTCNDPFDKTTAVTLIVNNRDGEEAITGTSNGIYINGNVICNGNMVFNNCTNCHITGYLIVNGDLNLGTVAGLYDNFKVDKGIYVNGNIYMPLKDKSSALLLNIEDSIYTTGYVEYKTDTNAYTRQATLTNSYDFGNLDIENTTKYPNVTVPGGVSMKIPYISGTVTGAGGETVAVLSEYSATRFIPVDDSEYYNFYKIDASGNVLLDGAGQPQWISANEWAGTDSTNRKIGNYTAKSFTAPAGATEIPDGGTVTVTGEQDFTLGAGSPWGKNLTLTITGGGTANIYLVGTSFQGWILSDDDTTVNFYAPTETYTWKVANFNTSIYSILCSNGSAKTLRFGNDDPNKLKAPKIKFYMEAGTTWNATQSGWCLMTGYIFAPDATIKACKGLDMGKWGTSTSGYLYTYNGGNVQIPAADSLTNVTSNPMFIGAVLAKEIEGLENNAVVAYIKDEDNPEPGLPKLKWKATEYRVN